MNRVELTLITNEPSFARRAEHAGIDRIMIDLERLGKAKRQSGRQLFLSDHRLSDIERLRATLFTATIQVRVNAWHEQSILEINDVILRGAQIVMLPMVRDREQAARFVGAVDGRARTSLLVETANTLDRYNELLGLSGIDEVHIGLNDLAIDLGRESIFDALADRLLDDIAGAAAQRKIRFGFGAVAGQGCGALPIDPEIIIREQIRLRASVAWLSRSYGIAAEKLSRAELASEIKWIRRQFSQPAEAERNFCALEQQLNLWKALDRLAVAS